MRIRSRLQYQKINQSSGRHVGEFVVIDVRKTNCSYSKLGITVSRRYGDAVNRNRFKRIVREAFRLCRHKLPPGLEMNVKPRTYANHAITQDIIRDFMKLGIQKDRQE